MWRNVPLPSFPRRRERIAFVPLRFVMLNLFQDPYVYSDVQYYRMGPETSSG